MGIYEYRRYTQITAKYLKTYSVINKTILRTSKAKKIILNLPLTHLSLILWSRALWLPRGKLLYHDQNRASISEPINKTCSFNSTNLISRIKPSPLPVFLIEADEFKSSYLVDKGFHNRPRILCRSKWRVGVEVRTDIPGNFSILWLLLYFCANSSENAFFPF